MAGVPLYVVASNFGPCFHADDRKALCAPRAVLRRRDDPQVCADVRDAGGDQRCFDRKEIKTMRIEKDDLPFPDDETTTKWRAEALAHLPNPDAWADFTALLRCAAELDRRGINNSELPPGMTAPQKSLWAILKFLEQQHILMKCGDLGPLFRLYTAIVDLANGRVSPMFKPVERRVGNPGKGLGYEVEDAERESLNRFVQAWGDHEHF
jgi:hypothetical protein